jgi:hypothetical protein
MFVRLCADKISYEVKLQKRITFDVSKVRESIERAGGYEVTVQTPYILVLRARGGEEVTFSSTGRMLVKRVQTEEAAKSIAHELLSIAMKTLE